MVTMREIDRAREELQGLRILASWPPWELGKVGLTTSSVARAVRTAEAEVERLLRAWWAQDCQNGDYPPCPSCETGPVRVEAGKNVCRCGESVFWGDAPLTLKWKARAETAEAALAAVRPTEAQWREMLASVRADAFRAESKVGLLTEQRLSAVARADTAEAERDRVLARFEKVCNAMQSMSERARGACAAPPSAVPSAPNDWIDELISLLRVTRGQRDDAEERWHKETLALRDDVSRLENEVRILTSGKPNIEAINDDLHKEIDRLRKLIDGWKEKYDSINRHREDQEKLIETLQARVRTLTRSVNEMDATNKKIHADRDRWAAEAKRLAGAIADALKVLRASTGDPNIAEEILSFAVSAHGGDDVKDGPKGDGTPYATHTEVEAEIVRQYRDEIVPRVEKRIDEKIERALEEHYKVGHPLD